MDALSPAPFRRPQGCLPRGACRRPGFTLVEMLVVVAVIAILAGLLLPALNSAKEMALAAVCLNQQKQVSLHMNMYANDTDGYFITNGSGGWQLLSGGYGYPDLKTQDACCPVFFAKGALRLNSGTVEKYTGGAWSWGWNCTYGVGKAWLGYSTPQYVRLFRQCTKPTEVTLLADSWRVGGYPYALLGPGVNANWGSAAAVHHKRVNVCFVDGHAGGIGYGDLIGKIYVPNWNNAGLTYAESTYTAVVIWHDLHTIYTVQ